MSRQCWSPWCFTFGGWLHFWRVWLTVFPAGLQGSDSSIKIAVFLPNCRKRSNAVFTLPHHLDHLSSEVVLLGRLAGLFCSPRPAARLCPIMDHRFPTICFLRLTVLSLAPLVPVSLCPPFSLLSPLSSLSRFLPQRSALFVCCF